MISLSPSPSPTQRLSTLFSTYNLSGYCPLPSQFSFLAFSPTSILFHPLILSLSLPTLSSLSFPILSITPFTRTRPSPSLGRPRYRRIHIITLFFYAIFLSVSSQRPEKRVEEFIDSCGLREKLPRGLGGRAAERGGRRGAEGGRTDAKARREEWGRRGHGASCNCLKNYKK